MNIRLKLEKREEENFFFLSISRLCPLIHLVKLSRAFDVFQTVVNEIKMILRESFHKSSWVRDLNSTRTSSAGTMSSSRVTSINLVSRGVHRLPLLGAVGGNQGQKLRARAECSSRSREGISGSFTQFLFGKMETSNCLSDEFPHYQPTRCFSGSALFWLQRTAVFKIFLLLWLREAERQATAAAATEEEKLPKAKILFLRKTHSWKRWNDVDDRPIESERKETNKKKNTKAKCLKINQVARLGAWKVKL